MYACHMDEHVLSDAIQVIAERLAQADLHRSPDARFTTVGPDNDDHMTRLMVASLPGDEETTYRSAAADVREPLRAIRRMHAARVGFDRIVERARRWLDALAEKDLNPAYPPAWAIWAPANIRPLMTTGQRKAFDLWLDCKPGEAVWLEDRQEFNGHGGEFSFEPYGLIGLQVTTGEVRYGIERVPETVRTAAAGKPLADVLGLSPHGIPIHPTMTVHSIVNISPTHAQIFIQPHRWVQLVPVPSDIDFTLPGPATVGRVPDPTDGGWGYD
jgi:hypothetical protein